MYIYPFPYRPPVRPSVSTVPFPFVSCHRRHLPVRVIIYTVSRRVGGYRRLFEIAVSFRHGARRMWQRDDGERGHFPLPCTVRWTIPFHIVFLGGFYPLIRTRFYHIVSIIVTSLLSKWRPFFALPPSWSPFCLQKVLSLYLESSGISSPRLNQPAGSAPLCSES